MPIGVIFIKTCTFFGHRDCSTEIKNKVYIQIEKLIIENDIKLFYVGNKGSFDAIVLSCLEKLSDIYKDIKYFVVLEKIPVKDELYNNYCNTLIPENIENIMPKFAINYRNKWMIDKSNYVIAYVTHDFGGAAKFMNLAIKRGKTVINLYDDTN